ncbi:hypothetical protein BDV93DRAFT_602551 [Ceratobasidium sp. AG-I]|nr:hypothetical protein BDV93DRAFT_602551 [Ceratobasidium sp. AG-I]
MSQQRPASEDSRQDSTPPAHYTEFGGQPLPAFQPFPSRPRDSLAAGHEVSSTGHYTTHRGSVSTVAPGGPGHTQSINEQSFVLPEFTPFPVAAASSRYAPSPGVRAESTQPVLPPTSAQEPTSSSRYPAQPVVGSSMAAIRYPSGMPAGQPSCYAPPGPLTARPHVCDLCDSGFARAHDLKRHIETHKGERPHRCPNCQRAFSRKDAVQRHLVITQCGAGTSNQ